MNLLDVDILEASYDRNDPIISNVKFSINAGEIVGLIGPNGAGKSTTIKAIIGLIQHLKGSISFIKDSTYSYVPEHPIFYDELTLWEHIQLIAGLENISQEDLHIRAESLLNTYSMSESIHQLPTTFSKGMQQKVMLILASLIRPDIYIIDEPFIGLDPHSLKSLLAIIEAERSRGSGILMSTHVLDTAEKICDRFIIINGGSVEAIGSLEEIRDMCQLEDASLFDCFHFLSRKKKDV